MIRSSFHFWLFMFHCSSFMFPLSCESNRKMKNENKSNKKGKWDILSRIVVISMLLIVTIKWHAVIKKDEATVSLCLIRSDMDVISRRNCIIRLGVWCEPFLHFGVGYAVTWSKPSWWPVWPSPLASMSHDCCHIKTRGMVSTMIIWIDGKNDWWSNGSKNDWNNWR